MIFNFDLLINAVVSGIMIGGFYAAMACGVSLAFGILDIVNIAHPAFIILGSYIAYIVNDKLGVDPILISIVALPAFYALGAGIYQIFYIAFERRGQESLRGLAFFFGLLSITEVSLVLYFGVDYRLRQRALYRPDLAFRRRPHTAAHPGAMPGVTVDDRLPAAAADAHLHRPRHHGGGAGSAGAPPHGGATRSASSASPSAFPSPPPRSPAPS